MNEKYVIICAKARVPRSLLIKNKPAICHKKTVVFSNKVSFCETFLTKIKKMKIVASNRVLIELGERVFLNLSYNLST